ncbi:hypothetical protein T484DRAFT_1881987, partial [Baffinella frigidus]
MARLRLSMLVLLASGFQPASSFHLQRVLAERCPPVQRGDPGGLAGVLWLRAEGAGRGGREGCFGMPSPGGESVLRLRGGAPVPYPRFEPPPTYTEAVRVAERQSIMADLKMGIGALLRVVFRILYFFVRLFFRGLVHAGYALLRLVGSLFSRRKTSPPSSSLAAGGRVLGGTSPERADRRADWLRPDSPDKWCRDARPRTDFPPLDARPRSDFPPVDSFGAVPMLSHSSGMLR